MRAVLQGPTEISRQVIYSTKKGTVDAIVLKTQIKVQNGKVGEIEVLMTLEDARDLGAILSQSVKERVILPATQIVTRD